MTTAIPNPLTLAPRDAPAVSSHIEARRLMMQGLEIELASLRHLDLGKRLHEMSFFLALWLVSITVNYIGYQSAAGYLHNILRVAGTIGTALAINTFILFLHEGMHKTLFASPVWNRWVSAALGWIFCISFTAYKVMHTRHHNYLGDPRDPDDYQNYLRNKPLLWTMHYGRLILGPYLYILVIPLLALRYGSTLERRHVIEEYVALISVYIGAALFIPGDILLYMWFIPLVITAHMTAIRGLTQHGITNAQDPFIASRSIQANPLVAFFLLNENFHLEHHLFPEIPSYNLAQVHKLIWPRLPRVVTGTSYLVFIFKFFVATLKMDERPIGFTDLVEWEA
jgi:fatty acid desaturase